MLKNCDLVLFRVELTYNMRKICNAGFTLTGVQAIKTQHKPRHFLSLETVEFDGRAADLWLKVICFGCGMNQRAACAPSLGLVLFLPLKPRFC